MSSSRKRYSRWCQQYRAEKAEAFPGTGRQMSSGTYFYRLEVLRTAITRLHFCP